MAGADSFETVGTRGGADNCETGRARRGTACRVPVLRAVRASLVVAMTMLLAGFAIGEMVSHGDGRAELEREAQRLIALPYWAFARAAAVHSRSFDWSSDGCSRTPPALAARFEGPCRQHDFAYRNLGRGLRLTPTETAREWADARFLDELRRRCGDLLRGWRLTRCRGDARAMWLAVRRLGRPWSRAGSRSEGAARRNEGCAVTTTADGERRARQARGSPSSGHGAFT